MSVGEREITRRISAVAVCWVRLSVSSRLLASSSLNRRTFSTAMTAWSANVLRSSICASEKGVGSRRETRIAPAATLFRSNGTTSMLRTCTARVRSRIDSGTVGSFSVSLRCTIVRPWIARQIGLTGFCTGVGQARASARRVSGDSWLWATRWTRSLSSRKTPQSTASQRRRALATIASKTGRASVGELEMTRRISLVAVCCCRASRRVCARRSTSRGVVVVAGSPGCGRARACPHSPQNFWLAGCSRRQPGHCIDEVSSCVGPDRIGQVARA